ncbi:glycosyltransferase family 2 protein [Gigaspora margarita]|uniref:Chitin synthase n=1 Tax=Gigaspora margarita TaxID=4874 RepID=A0A8H4AD01_GIGMA|nr:glycosyltransferase family 2 protein [Gigaspora margarita]
MSVNNNSELNDSENKIDDKNLEKTTSGYLEKLEKYLNELDIKRFDYSQCKDLKRIGQGRVSVVYLVTFQGEKYALKSLVNNLDIDNETFKLIRRKIKYNYRFNNPNIVKLYGFSIEPHTGNFNLVLQYANGGNLRDHLQKKRDLYNYKISWIELIQIATEITLGLAYLHENDIVHHGLHSMNILINDGKVLIADVGMSNQLNGSTSSSSTIISMMAYIDPQCLGPERKKQTKKSDIYSLGVILWELTSGIPPFYNLNDSIAIYQEIINDNREKIIENTPPDYANLYCKCWSSCLDQRPTLDEILIELKNLSKEKDIKFIINNNYIEIIGKYRSDTKTIDTNCDSTDSVSIEIDPKESNTITKRIELINGNLVIDCPIPLDLLLNIPNKSSKEYTHTRYTACTSKPNNFKNENYTLRQTEFDLLSQTEIFIEIAIHDEDHIQLSNTLYGVMENIAYLCSLKDSKIWGKDGWKKVVICIISNGHDDDILTYLTALGVYQDHIAKTRVNNKVIKAHIFEYTTQISIKYSGEFMEKKTIDDGIVPIQILFCLKENNKGKDNSHKWFFNAFCPILNPKICVFIKAGTKPGERSIYNLWKTFLNPQIAGTCGRLISMKDKTINPISCTQMFEHEISNILDKPFESIFGYITYLPEEFSAYRYCALEDISKNIQGTFILPMKYIKINRLLCFELISKHNKQSKWILHYENSSQTEIQVTKNLTDFISQQKKNLNEYFFVSFYSITHFYKIWISGHSIIRKIWLQIEIIYQAYKFIFSWFAFVNIYINYLICFVIII